MRTIKQNIAPNAAPKSPSRLRRHPLWVCIKRELAFFLNLVMHVPIAFYAVALDERKVFDARGRIESDASSQHPTADPVLPADLT